MAFTLKLHTTWHGIPADSVDPIAHWLALMGAETKSIWMAKCNEFVNAGKMDGLYAIELTPQKWERHFLDQAAIDEWVAWVTGRIQHDGVAATFEILPM